MFLKRRETSPQSLSTSLISCTKQAVIAKKRLSNFLSKAGLHILNWPYILTFIVITDDKVHDGAIFDVLIPHGGNLCYG